MTIEVCNVEILCISLKLLGSFLIGVFGSFAYVLTVYCGFAGGKTKEERDVMIGFLLPPHRKKRSKDYLKCSLYGFAGGGLVMIFQGTSLGAFVPLQSLIMGITWPVFVSSYLSGRQSEINPEERKKISEGVFESHLIEPKMKTEERKNEKLFKELKESSKKGGIK